MPITKDKILEWRGVTDLVAAEVTEDGENYTTGEVFYIAGTAQIEKTTDSSADAHYYDNIPAVVVANESSDEVTISVSAIPLDVLGKITGQTYDSTLGALFEGERTLKYFALGYKTQKNDGSEVYVWRLKGSFNVPDQTNVTKNDSTDANGQELVYTGISTTHQFTKTGKGQKSVVVDVAQGLANVSTFFDTVTTPDTLTKKTP